MSSYQDHMIIGSIIDVELQDGDGAYTAGGTALGLSFTALSKPRIHALAFTWRRSWLIVVAALKGAATLFVDRRSMSTV